MRPPIRATEFGGDLSEFLHKYKFQPKLTRKLDDLENLNLTPELLNESVLWKVNRYVSLNGDQLRCIDALRKLKPGEHEKLEANPLRIAEATEIVKVGENASRSMIWKLCDSSASFSYPRLVHCWRTRSSGSP